MQGKEQSKRDVLVGSELIASSQQKAFGVTVGSSMKMSAQETAALKKCQQEFQKHY